MKLPQRKSGSIYYLALMFDRYCMRLFLYSLKLISLCCVAVFASSLVSDSGITVRQTGYLLKIATFSLGFILFGGAVFFLVDYFAWRRFERNSSSDFWDSTREAWVGRNGAWLFLFTCICALLLFILLLAPNIFSGLRNA